jgi:hypothetical protein
MDRGLAAVDPTRLGLVPRFAVRAFDRELADRDRRRTMYSQSRGVLLITIKQ